MFKHNANAWTSTANPPLVLIQRFPTDPEILCNLRHFHLPRLIHALAQGFQAFPGNAGLPALVEYAGKPRGQTPFLRITSELIGLRGLSRMSALMTGWASIAHRLGFQSLR